jgi:hypothetical protein
VLYAAFGAGLWLSLRRPRPQSVLERREPAEQFSWTLWLGLAGVLVVTATVSRLLLGEMTWVFMIANLVVGAPVGVAILVLCVRDVMRRPPPRRQLGR